MHTNRSRIYQSGPYSDQRLSNLRPVSAKSTDWSRSWGVPKLIQLLVTSREEEKTHTVSTVTGTCTTQWVNPSAFGNPKFCSVIGGSQETCSCEIDIVECIHEKWVWDTISSTCSDQDFDLQGKQIIRFFFETVPMKSSVAAG
jgi:hypothetical protein